MYRCITNIIITQQPTDSYPLRTDKLSFDFVNEFTVSDSWRDLTNNGTLTLPKNLYYKDKSGRMQPLHGTNINIGGFGSTPLFLRGDKVSIEAGYKYFNKTGREVIDTDIMFTGYISKVNSKIPIELELEDNMWLCKQTPAPRKTFTASDTLEYILQTLIDAVNNVHKTRFTRLAITKTTFGEFQMGSESVAQVLQRMQKQYGFEFYFRGDQLRGGVLVYIESEAEEQQFAFQQNIISDDLEYRRKDDIVLSVMAHNTLTVEAGGVCKDGTKKTKRKRISVLVTIKNGRRQKDFVIEPGQATPENIEGERTTFFDPGAKTVVDLGNNAYNHLIKFYYDGYRGTFTTFGVPYIRQGDNARLSDSILPERNGLYKIKKVEYSGGVNGLRQTVHLDYKINIL